MLDPILQRGIAAASVTVHVTDEAWGRGVLVAGQLILTAAHVVIPALVARSPYPAEHAIVGMGMGDHAMLDITTTTHGRLRVAPYAIEPCTDIAVLGALDDQVFCEEAEAYGAWCEATAPVPLSWEALPAFTPVAAWVYTHLGTWLAGSVEQGTADAHGLMLTFPDGIEGGTSGSAVVTAAGQLVGLVSQAGGTEPDAIAKGRSGYGPRPHQALPRWVLHQIKAGEAAD